MRLESAIAVAHENADTTAARIRDNQVGPPIRVEIAYGHKIWSTTRSVFHVGLKSTVAVPEERAHCVVAVHGYDIDSSVSIEVAHRDRRRILSRDHIISWLKSAIAITEQDAHAAVVVYARIPKVHNGKIHLAVSVKISDRHSGGIRTNGIAMGSLEACGTVCRRAERKQN